jgi:hypothetical protein
MHRGINRVILAKKRPTAVQSLYMPIYKDVGHLWNVRAKMMDEGRSSRNSHYSTGNLLRAKLLDFKRSFRAIYTFFWFGYSCMHFSHSMSRIGHTNWRPLLLSLFVIHTEEKNEFQTSPCLFSDVFVSPLFKQ